MTRREAAQILGVRESAAEVSGLLSMLSATIKTYPPSVGATAGCSICCCMKHHSSDVAPQVPCHQHSNVLACWPQERVKDAHRRLMVANHPDAGGSSFIAAKVNEAKDMLLGKSRRAGSAF
jgi:hypothetical protein